MANQGAPDLTLVITDGQPNTNSGDTAHGGVHPSGVAPTNKPLYYAVVHSDQIKAGGSHIFVVGVGGATSHTFELSAISGNNPGTNVATNDYTTVTSFDALAASLRSVVFSLCLSSVTITKIVDGVPAPGWGLTATINSVSTTPAGNTFEWRNPQLLAIAPASRTATTAANGTAKIEWSLGSVANPRPGTANVTLSETAQPGFVFGSGSCTIASQSAATRPPVNVTSLPINIGNVAQDAFVTCTYNNLRIVTPSTPPWCRRRASTAQSPSRPSRRPRRPASPTPCRRHHPTSRAPPSR